MNKFSTIVFVTIAMVLLFATITTATSTPPPSTMTDEEFSRHSFSVFEATKARHLAYLQKLKDDGLMPANAASPNSAVVADVSTLVSVSNWQCLKNNGYVATIPRCYQSNGRVDGNFVQNNRNAIQAGFEYNDCYLFPCPQCGNPEDQVNQLWNTFNTYQSQVGMVWLDIEGTEYWMDVQSNINFMNRMLEHTKSMGAAIGIYASKSQWSAIFGNWSMPYELPLWWATYNYDLSCNGFSPFGGFSKAALHQFQGTTYQCDVGLDISSYC